MPLNNRGICKAAEARKVLGAKCGEQITALGETLARRWELIH